MAVQLTMRENGRHERMHRTLKEDTTKPPAASLRNQVPASLYIPSLIRLPRKLTEFTYPKGLLLRRVNNSGDISWHKNRVFISEVFRFEELGFELITRGSTESSFETWRSENSIPKSFVSELREEWSELLASIEGQAEADRRTLADLPLEKAVQMSGTASSPVR
jgi:hypothetical protein